MTATSVGWVLLDGQGLNAATLDHDAFEVQSSTDGDASDTSQHTAAARGAQAIATTSGHTVGSIRVTWTNDFSRVVAAPSTSSVHVTRTEPTV